MPDFNQLASRYIASWNETDPIARRAAIDTLWAEDARYIDPMASAHGRDEIEGAIGAVQSQFADFQFRLVGPIDGHHDQCRFAWELGPREGEAPIAGFDVAVVDRDGKLQTVLGFLDKVPAR
jgi:SnoaL-like domain